MNMPKRYFTLISVLLFLLVGQSLKSASISLDISEAAGYNLLTWGKGVLKNSSTEGRVAVGGKVELEGYSIGNKADSSDSAAGSLIVGNKLTAKHGQVSNGSIYVGGKYDGPNYDLNSARGSVTESKLGKENLMLDFAAVQASLTAKSNNWGKALANGTSMFEYSTLTLLGSNGSLNIFNIDSEMLEMTRTLNLFVPNLARVLINVSGRKVDFSNKGLGAGFDPRNTLFNFYEATKLTMNGIGIEGSILAPNANVIFKSGQMKGQLIAKSFKGSGSLHDYAFNNDEPMANVPDTGSTAWMGIFALVGVVWAKRFVGKRQTLVGV